MKPVLNPVEEVKKRLLQGDGLAVRAWALANDIKNAERLMELASEQIKKERKH